MLPSVEPAVNPGFEAERMSVPPSAACCDSKAEGRRMKAEPIMSAVVRIVTVLPSDFVLLDASGRRVVTLTRGENDVSALAPGVYFTLSEGQMLGRTPIVRQNRSVKRLLLAIGKHSITWDGRDVSGGLVPSGVYMYAFEAGGAQVIGRVVLARQDALEPAARGTRLWQ